MTPDWFYKAVGTVILITMIINVVSVPASILFFHFIRILNRLLDQSKIILFSLFNNFI